MALISQMRVRVVHRSIQPGFVHPGSFDGITAGLAYPRFEAASPTRPELIETLRVLIADANHGFNPGTLQCMENVNSEGGIAG